MVEFPANQAFCDTSFFFASLYPKDINYERAGQILAEALIQKISLWSTWDIISETVTLLLYRFNSKAAIRFLDEIKPALSIIYPVRNNAPLFCSGLDFRIIPGSAP